MTPLLKSNYATRLLYTIALGFVKTSILVFYMRLDHRKWTRWAIYFLMAFVAALSVTTFFFLAFVCIPPSLFWDVTGQATTPEKCLSQPVQQMFFNLNGVCNIIQDVSTYLLPIPMLWTLQMPIRQKLALGALFSIGLIAVAGKSWRLSCLIGISLTMTIQLAVYASIMCSSSQTRPTFGTIWLIPSTGAALKSIPVSKPRYSDQSYIY